MHTPESTIQKVQYVLIIQCINHCIEQFLALRFVDWNVRNWEESNYKRLAVCDFFFKKKKKNTFATNWTYLAV